MARVTNNRGVRKQQTDLPAKPFSIQITGEVSRIEVDDGAGRIGHQSTKSCRETMGTGSREDTHELPERSERSARVKINIRISDLSEIRGKRCIMVRIKPAKQRGKENKGIEEMKNGCNEMIESRTDQLQEGQPQ